MRIQVSESALDLIVTKHAPPVHPAFEKDDGYEDMAQAIADYCASLLNAEISLLETKVHDLLMANATIAFDKNKALEEVKRLTAERDAAVADAERYRWLRKDGAIIAAKGAAFVWLYQHQLDAAIESAKSENPNG